MWDYASLPQPERTPAEATRFAAGLASLMVWYAHPYTHVLLMSSELPTGASYTNVRPYGARGWCEVERATAAISKCTHCLWDYSGFRPDNLASLDRMHLYDALRDMLKSGRSAPMPPPAFAKALRRRVAAEELAFSNAADLETVIEMCALARPPSARAAVAMLSTWIVSSIPAHALGRYRSGFVHVFEAYRSFDPDGFFAAYAAMGWGEAEARAVAACLAYAAKHCKLPSRGGGVSLRLEGNQFGTAGQQAIEKAIKGAKGFEGAMF